MDEFVVNTTRIEAKNGLDPITVIWMHYGPGRGQITILCYDMAWTAWFGAIGDRTLREFFIQAETGYMVDKMVYAQFLKATVEHRKYMNRIVEAIKKEVRRADG